VNRQLSVEAKGGLSCLPDETLWLIVKGSPITQGSMRALAPGVMKHDKSGELNRWRNSISQALLMRCGSDWTRVGPSDVVVGGGGLVSGRALFYVAISVAVLWEVLWVS
jgi:hypothetical protein